MLAKHLLRVGAILLLLNSNSFAETIPFDYFYGRIIGRQHVQVNYSDNRNDLALYRLSYSVGFGDRAWLQLPDIVRWRPNFRGNTTDWTDPAINGSIRLSNSARYGFTLHYRDDDESSVDGEWRRSLSENSGNIDQSIMFLENGGIGFTPENDLYHYLQGMFLGDGQWLVEGSGTISAAKADYALFRQNDIEEYDSSWSHYRNRTYQASGTLGLGVASTLNFRLSSSVSHNRYTDVDSSTTLRVLPDDNLRTQWRLSDREEPRTTLTIGPQLVWKPKRSLWLTGAWDYWRMNRESELLRLNEDSMNPDAFLGYGKTESRYEYITYSGSVTWVSTDKAIELNRLLDNYQRYYGTEMSASTFILGGDITYRREYNGNESWSSGRLLSESWGRTKLLNANIVAKYYITPVISVSTAAHLDRRLTTWPYT